MHSYRKQYIWLFPISCFHPKELPRIKQLEKCQRVYIIFQDTCSFLFTLKCYLQLTSLEISVTSGKRVVIQTEAALFDIITCFWKKLPNMLLILISLNMLTLFLLYLFKCTPHFHMFLVCCVHSFLVWFMSSFSVNCFWGVVATTWW